MQQDIPPPPELPRVVVSPRAAALSGGAQPTGNNFLRFLLGMGIGSLPAPLTFLVPGNDALVIGCVSWCVFFVAALVLFINRHTRYIGLGMQIAGFITPVIVIVALAVLFTKSF